MRRLYCGALLLTAVAAQAVAEPKSFAATDPSGQFLVEALFPDAPPAAQQLGRALITVRDSKTLEPLQQLHTDAGNLPRVYDDGSLGWLMGENSLVFFKDFNFDGRLDLAIRNGTGDEDGWAFDIYLQDPDKVHWAPHPALSALARSGHMFSAYAEKRVIYSQTDRGCCWTRLTTYQWKGNALERLSTYTQEEIPPSDANASTSMPRGYMLRTSGEWKDGKWVEVPQIEGPVSEDAPSLVGTLDGKIPVALWYQDQGDVIIGEVRYTRTGSAPIKLVGNRAGNDDEQPMYLHEYSDDGQRTGDWTLTLERSQGFGYSGFWTRPGGGDGNRRTVLLRSVDSQPDLDKLGNVDNPQRSGRYQMRDDELGRDGLLELQVLAERDAQGRELAQFSLTLTDASSGQTITTEQQRVPMHSDNLIIVPQAQAPKAYGAYHIQLVKGFAVLKYNGQPPARDLLAGVYRKQP